MRIERGKGELGERKGSRAKTILILMAFIAGGLFLGAIGGVVYVYLGYKGILPSSMAPIPPLKERTNILVLGVDANYDRFGNPHFEHSRSDTMMLVGLDPDTKSVSVLSIPRDTRVYISPRYGYEKINAAHAIGGPMLSVKVVEDLLGIPIHHYLKTDFRGFAKLVDLIGGLDVYVEKDMHYVDRAAKLRINLKKGFQHLNGDQVHQYVRFRHDKLGDIGRIQRQQKVLKLIAEKLTSPTMIPKLPFLIQIGRRYVETDMSIREMMSIAAFAREIDPAAIQIATLPGAPANLRHVSYFLADPDGIRERIRRMFLDEVDRPYREIGSVDVEVLNGTRRGGMARIVGEMLRKKGLNVERIGSYERKDVEETVVILHGLSDKELEKDIVAEMRDVLGHFSISREGVGSERPYISVVVGSDLVARISSEMAGRSSKDGFF
jgi:LCP family protein required for cell wall assembly